MCDESIAELALDLDIVVPVHKTARLHLVSAAGQESIFTTCGDRLKPNINEILGLAPLSLPSNMQAYTSYSLRRFINTMANRVSGLSPQETASIGNWASVTTKAEQQARGAMTRVYDDKKVFTV